MLLGKRMVHAKERNWSYAIHSNSRWEKDGNNRDKTATNIGGGDEGSQITSIVTFSHQNDLIFSRNLRDMSRVRKLHLPEEKDEPKLSLKDSDAGLSRPVWVKRSGERRARQGEFLCTKASAQCSRTPVYCGGSPFRMCHGVRASNSAHLGICIYK